MNKARRKKIQHALDLLQQATEILAEVNDEEDEAFNNLPESIQESERGAQMEEYMETIDDAINEVDDIKANLEEIVEGS